MNLEFFSPVGTRRLAIPLGIGGGKTTLPRYYFMGIHEAVHALYAHVADARPLPELSSYIDQERPHPKTHRVVLHHAVAKAPSHSHATRSTQPQPMLISDSANGDSGGGDGGSDSGGGDSGGEDGGGGGDGDPDPDSHRYAPLVIATLAALIVAFADKLHPRLLIAVSVGIPVYLLISLLLLSYRSRYWYRRMSRHVLTLFGASTAIQGLAWSLRIWQVSVLDMGPQTLPAVYYAVMPALAGLFAVLDFLSRPRGHPG